MPTRLTLWTHAAVRLKSGQCRPSHLDTLPSDQTYAGRALR